jgi:hypothetical protein
LRLKLIARITDEELFLKCIHKEGALFYTVNGKGIIDQVAYFSGSRILVLSIPNGLSEEGAQQIKHVAFRVDRLEIDDIQGYIRIIQG